MAGLYIESKRDFHWRVWLLVFITIVFLAIVGWLAYRWFTTGEKPSFIPLPASALTDPTVNETPVSRVQINNHRVSATHPRYISIPALHITKARIQSIHLNNTLNMPANIHDAAWYRDSAFPGQGYGAVIISGHNDGASRDGVFFGLDKLKNGDHIIIERGDGKKITYVVAENRTESLAETNKTGMKRVSTPYDPDKEGLGLISPAGKWIPRDKVFDKRILIRAIAM